MARDPSINSALNLRGMAPNDPVLSRAFEQLQSWANITDERIRNLALLLSGRSTSGLEIDGANLIDGTVSSAKFGSLSADSIVTGTLDASLVNITNLNASNITTGTLTTNRLNVKNVILSNVTLTNNSPGAGYIAWSSFTITYNGTNYSISGSNTNLKYVYWNAASPSSVTASSTFTPGIGLFLLFVNNSGTADEAWQKIGTSSVQEDNLAFSLIVANQQYLTNNTYDLTSTGTNTLVNISGAGFLYGVGFAIGTNVTGAPWVRYVVTTDGNASSIYVYQGAAAFTTALIVNADDRSGNGSTANDTLHFPGGVGFRSTLKVDLIVDTGAATGLIVFAAHYGLKN